MGLQTSCAYAVSVGLIGMLLSVSASQSAQYTEAQKEEAKSATHYFKQAYWDCLAQYTPQAISKKLSGDDFKVLLSGACQKERNEFRVPFVDYLAMEYPDIALEEHFRQFDYVVTQAIDAEVARMLLEK